jgi:hypothetical protein
MTAAPVRPLDPFPIRVAARILTLQEEVKMRRISRLPRGALPILAAALLLCATAASAGQHGKKKAADAPPPETAPATEAAAPEPVAQPDPAPTPAPATIEAAVESAPDATVSASVAPADAAKPERIGLGFTALAGGSRVTEDRQAAHGSADLALGLLYELPYGFHLGAGFAGRFYDHGYLSEHPSIDGGGNERLTQEERFFDARLVVGNNVLSTVTDAVALNLDVAPRFTDFVNDSFGCAGWSVQLGAGLIARVAERMHLAAGGAWSLAFAGTADTLSALGLARHLWDVNAGAGFDFPGADGRATWSIELRWAGTVVVFDHSTRFYNGVLGGLGVTL